MRALRVPAGTRRLLCVLHKTGESQPTIQYTIVKYFDLYNTINIDSEVAEAVACTYNPINPIAPVLQKESHLTGGHVLKLEQQSK